MKSHSINAVLFALWPSRHGADLRARMESRALAGQPSQYRNT